MSSETIISFLNVNRGVTNLGDESKRFHLPRMSPFPKLDGRIVRGTNAAAQRSGSERAARRGVILGGPACSLPEMATDVIDPQANYATENVKRDRSGARLWPGAGLGHWMDRLWGSHRAARP